MQAHEYTRLIEAELERARARLAAGEVPTSTAAAAPLGRLLRKLVIGDRPSMLERMYRHTAVELLQMRLCPAPVAELLAALDANRPANRGGYFSVSMYWLAKDAGGRWPFVSRNWIAKHDPDAAGAGTPAEAGTPADRPAPDQRAAS